MRRRFQDFAFIHDQLLKSFPACVIPPIPDKHRLGEYTDVGMGRVWLGSLVMEVRSGRSGSLS